MTATTGMMSEVSSAPIRTGSGGRAERFCGRLAWRVVLVSAVFFAVGLLFAAIAHADVYWANYGSGGGGVGHASSAGTGVNQDFISAPDSSGAGPFKVAVGDGYIFWVDVQAGTIGRANINGTGVNQDFISTGGNNDLYGLAVSGNYLYFAYFAGIAGTGTGTSIGRVGVNGGAVDYNFIPLGTGVTPYGIAVDANYIYWEEETSNPPNVSATIARANLDGSGVNNDFISDSGSQGGVAVNADYIYYSDGNDISRANLDGSDPDSDFITTTGENDVAADSDYIYWASDGSSIGRANLDGTDVDNSFITGGHQTTGVAAGAGSDYDVSGFVYGDQCDTTCSRTGLDGVTVLVEGTASDGTAVSETDQTAADGSWSVQVPPGTYTACPTADGSTCGPPGFEPDSANLGYGNLPVTVTAAPVTGVNFDTCASSQDPSTTGSNVRPTLGGVGNGRRGAIRKHAAPADLLSACRSLYTVTIRASIPPKELVDASSEARYAIVANKTTHKIAYRDSSGAANALAHSVFLPLNKREYPACFSNSQVEQLSKRGRDVIHGHIIQGVNVDWYSYIEGGTLPSYTIPLAWNKSTHLVSPAEEPTEAKAELTKVFVWRSDEGSGRCYQTEEAPILVYPAVQGDTFTIIVAWGFPFEGSGVKVQEGIGFIDSQLHKLLNRFGDQGAKLWGLYEHAGEQYKEAAGILLTFLFAHYAAGPLVELLPEAVEAISGSALTTEEAGWLAKFGGVAERIEQSHTVAEVAGWLNGFGGSYPVMSAVIRGRFTNPNAGYDNVNHLYFGGQSVLGVSVASTKFPNISLKIERQTVNTSAGALPWANNRAATHATATANDFAKNPVDLVNDIANNDGRSYESGDFDAFKNIWADTSQLPAVAKVAKFAPEPKEGSETKAEKSDHHGALSAGFEAEQAAAPSPACSGTGAVPYLQTASKNTICWQFNDGKA
jgi:hypothetical protein